jgi:hypothetical protein
MNCSLPVENRFYTSWRRLQKIYSDSWAQRLLVCYRTCVYAAACVCPWTLLSLRQELCRMACVSKYCRELASDDRCVWLLSDIVRKRRNIIPKRTVQLLSVLALTLNCRYWEAVLCSSGLCLVVPKDRLGCWKHVVRDGRPVSLPCELPSR